VTQMVGVCPNMEPQSCSPTSMATTRPIFVGEALTESGVSCRQEQALAQTDFSDTESWSQAVYYGSLRFADVNGDGKPDICGRANLGNYCALAK
jgi:hypothetical protein